MASISTRSSVLAIKKETTEGTPVLPTLATDYVALQDDFTMSPSTDVLENAELKSSIAPGKPIQGAENPQASFSHYLRASGSVATAPNYGLLMEAAMGAVSTAAAEYNTVASSTTTVVKVDTGEGATFERGEALLIKDAVSTSGNYSIRCIDSISSDDLTIGFQTATAVGTAKNLGRAVLYKPANSGHPTLSLWHYLGNGGALQAMAGARVTDMSVSIAAGDLINANYSLEGTQFYFDPITITSTDTKLDFTDDDGTWAATIAAKTYKDPHELAQAIQDAMTTANGGETHTVTYSNTTGKFTIKTTGTLLSLLWNTGTNAANTIGDKIGFSTAADDTGTAATTGYTSDNAVSFASPQTPSFDNADPLAAKDMEVMVGDTTDYLCFNASSVDFSLSTPKVNISSVCATSGIQGSIINSRAVTVTIQAVLDQYDASKFKAYRANDNTKLQVSFGNKSGGNWVAGKCGAIYIPTATITSFEVVDNDGIANLTMELAAYADSSGQGEAYINFL